MDNEDGHLCDDPEHCCATCFREEMADWGRYFGLRPGMTKNERKAQLERMKPLVLEKEEEF
jgi:hypothetical protein